MLPRVALLLAMLPGLYALGVAVFGVPEDAGLPRLRLEQELQALNPAAVQAGVLGELLRRHGLWAIELRDRGDALLAQAERLPLARSGLLGEPLELTHTGSGALWRWWPVRALLQQLRLGAVGLLWCVLMILALRRLGGLSTGGVERRLGELSPAQEARGHRPRWRRLLDAAPCAIVVCDASGCIRQVNALAVDWLGRPAARLRGSELHQMLKLYRPGATEATQPWLESPLSQAALERWELRVGDGVRGVSLFWADHKDGGRTLALFDTGPMQAALRAQQQENGLLRQIINVLPVGVLLSDADNRIRMSNRTAERLFAWAPGELEGEAISKLMPVPFLNQPDIHLQDYRGQLTGEGGSLPKVVGWRKDATTFPVALTVEDLSEAEDGVLALIEDQTESLQREAAQSRLGRLFEQTAEEVLILDARSLYVREANRGAQDNLGLDLRQLRRMTLFHLAPELDASSTEPRLARLRAGDRRELRLSTSFRRADGSVYPVELSLTCSREEEPPVLMLLAHDVTALRAAENRLAWISGHDSLTRLPNRSAALEEMARLSRETGGYWVGLLGLGGLREVNADFGYEQGDVLLASIAERLQRALPEARMIARWSSSSFLLLLAQPLSSADGLLAGLSETLELEATSWQPRLSLGLCKGGTSLERSVEAAAALVAQARAAGGGWKSAEG